jgi:hypothetical protein
MRILHIDTGREMRGGQVQALALMRGLAWRGVEQALLAREGSPLYLQAAAAGLPVRPVGLAAIWSASRQADLVHAHDGRSHTLAAPLARAPLVVSRRVVFPIRSNLLSRWNYRRAACFIAISECVKRELVEAGIAESRIEVVYDGTTVPAEPSSGHRIVAPATQDPRKGAYLAWQAAALAGVELAFSDDLARDLPAAGLLVYLTQSEGLGSAILFAMAHALPVIASRVGGIPEIVEDGATGILVDNHAEAVAAAIHRLRNDPDLARRMGAEGRRRVLERFTFDHMVEGALRVYARLENRR